MLMMMRILFLSLLLLRLSVAFTDDLIEMSMSHMMAMSEQLDRSTTMTNFVPSKVKPIQSRNNVPQSLTLLMNFKNDGTTQFQIMQGRLRHSQCERMRTRVGSSRQPGALHKRGLVQTRSTVRSGDWPMSRYPLPRSEL